MNAPAYLIVRNKTHAGMTFRPSDWVDRMAATAGTFKNRRLMYNAKVMPCRKCEGHVCLKVDTALKTEMPHVYENIVQFMEINSLPDYVNSCVAHKPDLPASKPVVVEPILEVNPGVQTVVAGNNLAAA